MTKTPEQTLSDLLALGEKATGGKWTAGFSERDWRVDCDDAPGGTASQCVVSNRVADPVCICVGALSLWDIDERLNCDTAFIAASKNALPAIADALTRLSAYEEAVGEYFAQIDEHARAMTASIDAYHTDEFEDETKKAREASVKMDAAEARLRALQEK